MTNLAKEKTSIKVIQIVPEFTVGGAETMAEKLSYSLVKLGCDVIALSLRNYDSVITKRLQDNGIQLEYLGKKNGLDFKMFYKLYKYLKKEKPDAVHTHRSAVLYAIPAAFFAKVPVKVHTVHSIAQKENGKLVRLANRLWFRLKSVIPVSISDVVQQTVIDEYKIKKDKTPIVINGMPVDDYIPKISYNSDVINILNIGSIYCVKNQAGLIEAFAILKNEFSNIRLIIAGDGELRKDMEKLAEERGVSDYIEFKGIISPTNTVLNQSDIFCLPSHYEGLSLSIIEAMATGLPVVASNVGGNPDIVKDGYNGLLCETSPESIADKLRELILSEKLREQMGKNALESSKEFSSEKMALNYIKLYQNKR